MKFRQQRCWTVKVRPFRDDRWGRGDLYAGRVAVVLTRRREEVVSATLNANTDAFEDDLATAVAQAESRVAMLNAVL